MLPSDAGEKRQGAAAVQDAGARFGHDNPFGEQFALARRAGSGKIQTWLNAHEYLLKSATGSADWLIRLRM